MKNLLLASLISLAVSSACYAQEAAVSTETTTSTNTQVGTTTTTVAKPKPKVSSTTTTTVNKTKSVPRVPKVDVKVNVQK